MNTKITTRQIWSYIFATAYFLTAAFFITTLNVTNVNAMELQLPMDVTEEETLMVNDLKINSEIFFQTFVLLCFKEKGLVSDIEKTIFNFILLHKISLLSRYLKQCKKRIPKGGMEV